MNSSFRKGTLDMSKTSGNQEQKKIVFQRPATSLRKDAPQKQKPKPTTSVERQLEAVASQRSSKDAKQLSAE